MVVQRIRLIKMIRFKHKFNRLHVLLKYIKLLFGHYEYISKSPSIKCSIGLPFIHYQFSAVTVHNYAIHHLLGCIVYLFNYFRACRCVNLHILKPRLESIYYPLIIRRASSPLISHWNPFLLISGEWISQIRLRVCAGWSGATPQMSLNRR